MPRKRHKAVSPKVTHTQLGVKVDRYEACVEARINIDAKDPRYAFQLDDRDPVYQYVTRVKIHGVGTYPDDRIGHAFEITVLGDESPSRRVFPTIKDLQERGEYGQPLYREYRGRSLPVLRPPPGLGLLSKVRGEAAWTAWVNVAARLVSDMLVLLGSTKGLYLCIHERKTGRDRWIDSLGLQTTDPAEE